MKYLILEWCKINGVKNKETIADLIKKGREIEFDEFRESRNRALEKAEKMLNQQPIF